MKDLNKIKKFAAKSSLSLPEIMWINYAEDLGLNITYIRTHGIDGNIISRAVRQFYVDTTFNPNCEYHMTFEQLLAAIPEHLRKNVYCMHLKEDYDKSLIEQFNIAKERGE